MNYGFMAGIVASGLMLTACNASSLETSQAGADGRTVDLIAEAPDGTKLWRFWAGGRYVYFASSGAQWSSACGKSCVKTDNVPTAAVPIAD